VESVALLQASMPLPRHCSLRFEPVQVDDPDASLAIEFPPPALACRDLVAERVTIGSACLTWTLALVWACVAPIEGGMAALAPAVLPAPRAPEAVMASFVCLLCRRSWLKSHVA
jgi:hypothetical protein